MRVDSPHPEKRAHERIPALIDIHCFSIDCYGTITNLSVNGMFITSQKMSFPFDTKFEICIPLQEDELKVGVRVNRITKSTGYYDGVAVELVNPSEKYLQFISRLRASDRSLVSFHNI
ncbi:MAG: PilZ domain-containing protein [Nitrospiraceae bacterium]|nr:MAG: PilZ domain-containing protein [Nitrospiraceae bacterium]